VNVLSFPKGKRPHVTEVSPWYGVYESRSRTEMFLEFFLQGVIIGFVVAVPVGPLGLLCINRALSMGPLCGFFSGLGVATADALAAGVAALGITLVSSFFIAQQTWLRLAGSIFLCYLGVKIYRTRPVGQRPAADINGLLSPYVTTFLLTVSNPVTILSFIAIYAGWGVEGLSGHYFAVAILTAGVFTGSALWWVCITSGVALFRDRFSRRALGRIHKISGAVIAGFGIVVFLSLLQSKFGLRP